MYGDKLHVDKKWGGQGVDKGGNFLFLLQKVQFSTKKCPLILLLFTDLTIVID